MKYKLVGKDLYYDGLMVDSFPSKGEAYSVLNHIQIAYNDGRLAEAASQGSLKKQIEETTERIDARPEPKRITPVEDDTTYKVGAWKGK